MRTKLFTFILLAILVSCNDDNDDKTPLKSNNRVIDATSQTEWVYFSFDKDTIVSVVDPQNSLEWDIAFQRYMIKTNGGKSGKGNAGVYATDTTGENGMKAILSVSDTISFVQDDSVVIYGYNPTNPSIPTVNKYVLSPVLTDWYDRKDTPNGSLLISKKIVYLFRTATGKYAKFYIDNYYNDAGKSGYITLVYKYQKDGSRSLE
jgi:hypothetical protein